jgi:hypothetical protein
MMTPKPCRLETPSAIPSPRPLPVAFVNEIVSDADIDAYGLPFEKGKGHWWTRDKERDLYLWGGEYGNPAWGDDVEGRFSFFIDGKTLRLALSLGVWSKNWNVSPYIVTWDRLLWIDPPDCYAIDRSRVIDLVQEALVAYGRDGRENRNTPDRIVRFGF